MTAAAPTHSKLFRHQVLDTPSAQDSFVPMDLREWLDPCDLIDLILETVRTLYWTNCEEDAHGSESPDNVPQIILGLLAYCYATDLYSAVEIVQRAPTDSALRCLCRNRRFHPRQLHLVRSYNRELLHHCLSRVLRRAWEVRSKGIPHSTTTSFDISLRKHFDAESGDRVKRAIEADRRGVVVNIRMA